MYSIDIKDKLMIGRRNLHERIFNRKRIHGAGRRQIYVICFRGGLPGLYGGLTEGDRAVCHSGGVPDKGGTFILPRAILATSVVGYARKVKLAFIVSTISR